MVAQTGVQVVARLPRTFVALVLLTSALAACLPANAASGSTTPDGARSPDLTMDVHINGVAMAPDGTTLAFSDDPGSSLTNNATVDTWRIWDAAGHAVRSGNADHASCSTRPPDVCQAPVVAGALSASKRFAVAAEVTAAAVPTDTAQGVLVVGTASSGETARADLAYTPTALAMDTAADVIVVGGTVAPLGGTAHSIIEMFEWSDDKTLASVASASVTGTLHALAVSGDGSVAVAGAAQLVRFTKAGATALDLGSQVNAVAVGATSPHTILGATQSGDGVFLNDTHFGLPAPTVHTAKAVTAAAADAFATTFLLGHVGGADRVRPGPGLASTAVVDSIGFQGTVEAIAIDAGLRFAALAGSGQVEHVHLASPLWPMWNATFGTQTAGLAASAGQDHVAMASGRSVRIYQAVSAVSSDAPATILTSPPVPVTVNATFHNSGNRPAGAAFLLHAPDTWNVTFSPANLSLEPGQSMSVRVHIDPPPPPFFVGPGDYSVTLNASSFGVRVPVTMPRIERYLLEAPGAQSLGVDAGQLVVFTARITNTGNDHATPRPTVSVQGDGWSGGLDNPPPDLYPGKTADVRLKLVAPASAAKGSSATATLHLDGATDLPFTATVGAAFAPLLQVPTQVEVKPGEPVASTITVENAGNAPDSILVTLDPKSIPPGWIVAFSSGTTQQDVRGIAAGGAVLLPISIQATYDATAGGTAILKVHAQSDGDASKTADRGIQVKVAGKPGATTTPTKKGPGPAPAAVLVGLAALALASERRLRRR